MKSLPFWIYILIWIIILLHPYSLFSQSAPKLLGAATAALAMNDATSTGVWSVDGNPAGIATEPLSVGIGVNNHFCESSMSVKGIAAIIPIANTRLGLLYSHFGEALLSEQHLGLSMARLFSKLQVGISGHLYSRQSSEAAIPNRLAVGFSLGVMAPINKKLSVGIASDNPIAMYWNDPSNETLTQRITLGILWQMRPDWNAHLAVEKQTNWPLNIKIGLEYQPAKRLSLRLGYSSEPASIHFGTGLNWNHFSLNLATLYQTTTGLSPQIAIQWNK